KRDPHQRPGSQRRRAGRQGHAGRKPWRRGDAADRPGSDGHGSGLDDAGDRPRRQRPGPRHADPRPRFEVGRRQGGRPDRHPGLALQEAELDLPGRDPGRRRHQRLGERHRPLLAGAGEPTGSLRLVAPVRARARPQVPPPLMRLLVEPAKVGVLVFVAAILQVSIFSTLQILGGAPDVVLLTLVGIALLRGSIYGACAGFFAGLLIDTANLGTLGVTSLLPLPVYALTRWVLGLGTAPEGATEVQLLG